MTTLFERALRVVTYVVVIITCTTILGIIALTYGRLHGLESQW